MGESVEETLRGGAARLVRTSRTSMLIGWTLSAAGSEVVLGASPALVVAAALPAVWVADYSTLEGVEGMLSPLMVRLLGGVGPGRVLVACETYDVALLAVALAALALGAPVGAVLASYLILSSPVPLVLDVAEEIYGAEMTAIDPETSFAFTSHLHSLTALISRVVSLPLGALLTFVSPPAVLAVNLVLSLGAITLRLRGMRAEERAVGLVGAAVGEAEGMEDEPLFASSIAALRHLLRRPLVSPVSILARSVAMSMAGGYVLINVGTARGHNAYTVVLVAMGLGATTGPQLARLARGRFGTVPSLTAVLVVAAAGLAGSALLLPTTLFWAGAALLVTAETCSWSLGTLLIGGRQIALKGQQFLDATAWAQGAGALGGVLGSWAALALGTTTNPRPALLIAAAVYAALALHVRLGDRPQKWVGIHRDREK